MAANRTIIFVGSSLLVLGVVAFALFKYFGGQSPEEIFLKNKKSLVLITRYNFFGKASGLGSGFFVDASGIIATNYHVIKDAANIQVKTNDERVPHVLGVLFVDELKDFALIKVKPVNESEYVAVTLGRSDSLSVGEKVYAIGNPRGLESTFSEGIVSGLREMRSGVSAIQISAPISPGSSGGPVLDDKGRVVGISTFLVKDGQNLNFALPIDNIRPALSNKSFAYTFPSLSKEDWLMFHKKPLEIDVGIKRQATFYYDPRVIKVDTNKLKFWVMRNYLFDSSMPERGYYYKTDSEIYDFIEVDCEIKKIRVTKNIEAERSNIYDEGYKENESVGNSSLVWSDWYQRGTDSVMEAYTNLFAKLCSQ